MRRVAPFAVLTAGWLVTATLGSVALAGELEEVLQGASDAEFSGSQIVVSYWDEEITAGIYTVAQSGGMTRVGDGSDTAMVGSGMFEERSDDGLSHTVVSEWAAWRLHERYGLGSKSPARRLGRDATTISVLENGTVRMVMVIDNATGAALSTQVFDGDGHLYRMAVLLDFQPGAAPMRLEMEPGEEYEVVEADSPISLPAEVAGYWRADTYAGPGGTLHAFYTDGLFSFSVFEFAGQAEAGPFANAKKWRSGGETYRRISGPSAVRLYWTTPDVTYLLIGDLPPDHLIEALDELPSPARPGFIARVWRGLFG